MENQQTTDATAQNQPLNSAENGNSAAQSQNERITKIKQKFLPGFRITLLLSLAIYVAMLVIGILAVHKCPAEENIPLFLIATGAIGLITKILTYMRERILKHFQVKYIESTLYTVETVFLILGAYWVYKQYPPSYDPATEHYCQKTAYLFAFIYITILLVCLGLVLLATITLILCCAICITTITKVFGCILDGNDDDEDEKNKDEDQEKELKPDEEGTSKDVVIV